MDSVILSVLSILSVLYGENYITFFGARRGR